MTMLEDARNASSVRVDPERFVDDGYPHGNRGVCRRCDTNATTAPLADLVIVFRECTGCSVGPHWVEQLAHRRCFGTLVAADVLRDQAADHATDSRDFGRGYAHAVAVLRGSHR